MESEGISCKDADSDLYLIKLPKYLAENILKKKNSSCIGYIEPTKNQLDNIPFQFDGAGINVNELSESEAATFRLSCLPHVFVDVPVEAVDSQVLCQNKANGNYFCGKVLKRIDCRAIPSSDYMNLKRKTLLTQTDVKKRAIQMDRISHFSFNPKSDHGISSRVEKIRKEETKKIRGEKEDVLHDIFSCFEKQQYFSLKELSEQTKQPMNFLKEIVQEVCVLINKPSLKNVWELKKEYRHYS